MARFQTALAGMCLFWGLLVLGAPAEASEAPAYKIASVDGETGSRRLAVRIDTRLPEKALKDLAGGIAAKAKTNEQIAVVKFYLPGSELVQEPWATARFDGANISVTVSGLRAEEEAAFLAEAEQDMRDVVGVWLTSPPALPGKLTILKAPKGRFIAEWHLRSGQKTSDEVTRSQVSRGYRYDVVGGDGAYYLATWGGALQLGDATRVIAMAEKLVVEKKPVNTAKPVAAASPLVPAATTAVPAANPTTLTDASKAVPRPQRAKAPVRQKSRSSVADLMGGSIAR